MNTRGVAEKFPVLLGGGVDWHGYVEKRLGRDLPGGEECITRERFRGAPEVDGHHRRRQARRGTRQKQPEAIKAREKKPNVGPPRLIQTHCRTAQSRRRASRGAQALRCRGRHRRSRRRYRRGSSRAWPTTERALFWAGGFLRGQRTAVRSVLRRDRGARPRLQLADWTGHRRHLGARRRGVRLFPAVSRAAVCAVLAGKPATRCATGFFPPGSVCACRFHRGSWPPSVAARAPFQPTMGRPIANFANELFASTPYRDYLGVAATFSWVS